MSTKTQKLIDLLYECQGRFVTSVEIEHAVGATPRTGGRWIDVVRKSRPDLTIETVRGSGYRLVNPPPRPIETAEPAPPPPPEFEPPRKPKSGNGRSYRLAKGDKPTPMHVRMAASMAVLDLIPTKAAEILKVIALESGETTDETMLRLLSYGCEVHRDLVGGGANPISLRSPRTSEREDSRHER